MFHIVLFEPEIPPNTGNILRLCANTGCHLNIIEPTGFALNDKTLKRAGMDYIDMSMITKHMDFASFIEKLGNDNIFLATTKASTNYTDVVYKPGCKIVFGPESRGLPTEILDAFPTENKIKIPMISNSRSLNLSNSVAIVTYEAWRQNNFKK